MSTKPKAKHTLPQYPTIAACSGATGIPVATLGAAKRDGCPAFDAAGWVQLAALLQWIFRPGAEEGDDWPDRLKRAQALLAEIDLQVRKDELWVKADVLAARRASAQKVRAVLDSRLLVDLPARMAGRPAEEIQASITAALDEAYVALQST